jgi:hypothetical protein
MRTAVMVALLLAVVSGPAAAQAFDWNAQGLPRPSAGLPTTGNPAEGIQGWARSQVYDPNSQIVGPGLGEFCRLKPQHPLCGGKGLTPGDLK